MKYRILALLDKLTGHRLHFVCNYVWDWELDNIPMPEGDPQEEEAFWDFYLNDLNRVRHPSE